jgi:serine/threonine protein kinase/tetratricopeptide (TPR) repeat protein
LSDSADVRDIFDRVFQLPAAQRAAFLARACQGDFALQSEVERLLSAHERLGDIFETMSTEVEGSATKTAGRPPGVQSVIGVYRIVKEIGRGGSGAVYLAVRDDDEYRKTVAIKLLRSGMHDAETVRRFRHERQILASIEHPLIAKLLDGGSMADGSPYLVMEYIDGLPIDVYCDANRLPVASRLDLFRKVCAAVQFAHQNLVVHRDIKPSNILVTPNGVPKLLDFGIAKPLDPAAFSLPADATLEGSRLMTPEYASPEQIRGEPVTTATDVYALGVLLYKLLTGRRPYRLRTGELPEIARAICEEEPTRPSSVVGDDVARSPLEGDPPSFEGTPDRLRRRLQGDLDNIVLRAIRKEPHRRYVSAEQLADDIERHLSNLPVRARPDTVRYRTAKFVRRHRLGVAVAAAFVVFVIAAATGLSIQAARIARERDRADASRLVAEREAAKARAINQFLLRTLGAANPQTGPGRDVTLAAALSTAASTARHAFGTDPEVEAGVLNVVGMTFVELGRYSDAAPLLERALSLRKGSSGSGAMEIAESLESLATLRRWQGQFADTERLYKEALTIARSGAADPDRVVQILHGLGQCFSQRGDEKTALTIFDEAMTLARERGASERPRSELLASSGISHRRLGNPAQAEANYRQALEIQRRLLGPEHAEVGTLLNNLGVVLNATGRYVEAESVYREALKIRQVALGPAHPLVANSMLNLAISAEHRADPASALMLYKQAADIVRGSLGGDHPRLAAILRNWGVLLGNQQRTAEAIPLLKEALRIRRAALGPESRDAADAQSVLAGALRRSGALREAETLTREALAINLKLLGPDSEDVATNRKDLGSLLCASRPHRAALDLLKEATDYYARHSDVEPLGAAIARGEYGECLTKARRFPEAEKHLIPAYEHMSQLGPGHRWSKQAARRLADLYNVWGKPLQAAKYARS